MKHRTHRKQDPQATAARDVRIRELYAQGVTLAALGQRFGLGTARLSVIVRAETAVRRPYSYDDLPSAEIERRFQQAKAQIRTRRA